MKFIILLFLILPGQYLHAGFETLNLSNYNDIEEAITAKTAEFAPGELLVVFDIDHTILLMDDCLNSKKKGFGRVLDMIKFCPSFLTSEKAMQLIYDLQDNNYNVMALTARGFGMVKATLAQFKKRLRLNKDNESPQVQIDFPTAPIYSEKTMSISFVQTRKDKEDVEKKLVHIKGFGFLQGANKGLGLQAYLKASDHNFKHIIFIDDSLTNIENLECAFDQSKETNITIIHYLEYAKKRKSRNPCNLR